MENSSKNQENKQEKISPYVEWLTLRKLVKDNNKELSSRFAKEFNNKKEEYSYCFRSIAENFMNFDDDALEIYKNLNQKNWINHLSSDDLFTYFNYQNKILSANYLFDIDSVAYKAIYSMSLFIEKKLSFKGKPQRQECDKKQNRPGFSNRLAVEVLTNNTEKFSDIVELYKNEEIPFEDKFDKSSGFNLGKYQLVVKENVKIREAIRKQEELEKLEQERKTRETAEEEDKQPYLPGFEELFM